jgi:hypothetical protein
MSQQSLVFNTGRLGNRFFANMAFYFLSQTYGTDVQYTCEPVFNELGIWFHKTAHPSVLKNPKSFMITDDNFMDLIKTPDQSKEYEFYLDEIDRRAFYQTREFALYLAQHFANPLIRNPILQSNPFKSRYNTNRDVFVHVRLGDVTHFTPSKAYFETALQSVPFEGGYVSSDSPTHPLVQELMAKYKLRLVQDTEVRTLQLASTCRFLVLSQGTFSFMMGLFGFYTELVQWPQIKQKWHGDIFVLPGWKEVAW